MKISFWTSRSRTGGLMVSPLEDSFCSGEMRLFPTISINFEAV